MLGRRHELGVGKMETLCFLLSRSPTQLINQKRVGAKRKAARPLCSLRLCGELGLTFLALSKKNGPTNEDLCVVSQE